MDYAVLKAEIAKPEYAALDDIATAQAVNAKAVAAPAPYDTVAEDAFYSAIERQVARGKLAQEQADALIADHEAKAAKAAAVKRPLFEAPVDESDVKNARAS